MENKIDIYTDAIVVSNLWKIFRIPHEKKNTFYEFLTSISKDNRYEEFIALKNINFTVKKGEAIGVIGENGSGKSTLLKIITNILRADKGFVKINGKITSFLELGVGFQPDLTVKENIYLYGAVMGLSDKDIDMKINDILNFSGLKRFEDTKLKNLSSGMQVRLAFSTAIQTNPEILLMDEVLAVGDMKFQQKCLDIFQKYIQENKTIVFVSHDLNSVRRFCKKSLLLRHGEQIAFGDTNEIIDKYVYGTNGKNEQKIDHRETEKKEEQIEKGQIEKGQIEKGQIEKIQNEKIQNEKRWGNKKVEITGVKLIDKFGRENTIFNSNDPMTIQINYDINLPVNDLIIGIAIYSDNNMLLYGTNTDIQKFIVDNTIGDKNIKLYIHKLAMIEGKFYLTVAAHSKGHIPYDWLDKQFSFNIIKKENNVGLFEIPCNWHN